MNNITPKQAGFVMPAEWHPHERCYMAWPCHETTWQDIGLERARDAYVRVAKAIAQYEPVSMIVDPSDELEAKKKLVDSSIEWIVLPINDSWTRDTGPTFLLNQENQLAAVDWIHNAWGGNYEDHALDDELAAALIKKAQARYFKAPLVMEGGSFHVDGEGTILTTKECLLHPTRNPHMSCDEIADMLKNHLGGEHVIWLNQGLIGDETNGHVDEIACFVAPGEVLCLVTEDPEDENYDLLQENLRILQTCKDAKGRALQVHTVNQPPATYLNGKRLTLSYINFYLANSGIVMPAFGYEKYDREAFLLFSKLFAHHKITQIDAMDVFAGGGGIHCITQQRPRAAEAV